MWEGVCKANRGVVEEIYLNKFYLNCYCKYNNLQICNFHLTVQRTKSAEMVTIAAFTQHSNSTQYNCTSA